MKWHVNFQDIVQNLFLFFLLGVLLAHELKRSLFVVIMYGAALSSAIEVIQLSDIGRTSNYCDIVANTLGALMGGFYSRYLVSATNGNTLDVSLVFMLMPLCWFVSMRSATQELMAWLVLPIAIVALSIFKQSLSSNRLKWVALLIWLVFSLMPLIYISRNVSFLSIFNFNLTSGIIVLVIAPLVVSKLYFLNKVKQRFYTGILFLTTFLIIAVNINWYLSKRLPVSWTVPAHLHWIDTLMSLMVLMFAYIWGKQSLMSLDNDDHTNHFNR